MLNSWKNYRNLLLVEIALSYCFGCDDSTRHAGKGPPPASAYVYNPHLDKRGREDAESFAEFDKFAEAVRRFTSTKIYEGLPHSAFERDLFDSERDSKEIVEVGKELFYSKPIVVTATSMEQVRSLLAARTSFVPFIGIKMCGGFHADWALVGSDGTDEYEILLCFGCGEMIVDKNHAQLIRCDIWDTAAFERVLNPLHLNRPHGRDSTW